jgi:hypothetical protein
MEWTALSGDDGLYVNQYDKMATEIVLRAV